MRYVAIILLSIIGIVEFAVRASVVIVLVCTVIGILLFIEEDNVAEHWLKPLSFKAVESLLAEGPAKDKQIASMQREIGKLRGEKTEIQNLLVAHDNIDIADIARRVEHAMKGA